MKSGELKDQDILLGFDTGGAGRIVFAELRSQVGHVGKRAARVNMVVYRARSAFDSWNNHYIRLIPDSGAHVPHLGHRVRSPFDETTCGEMLLLGDEEFVEFLMRTQRVRSAIRIRKFRLTMDYDAPELGAIISRGVDESFDLVTLGMGGAAVDPMADGEAAHQSDEEDVIYGAIGDEEDVDGAADVPRGFTDSLCEELERLMGPMS